MFSQFLTASLIGLSLVTPSVAPAGDHGKLSEAQYDKTISDYIRHHPGDFTGLNRIVYKQTGEDLQVSISDYGIADPATAESVYAARKREKVAAKKSTGVTPYAIPTDAFTVFVTYVPKGGRKLAVYGQWNWRDDFVGQGSPYDVASLQFTFPDCTKLSGLNANTGKWDGTVTNRATLRDAGIGTKAPIWNIDDQVSGFANLADNGYVSGTLDASQCLVGGPANVGIAFSYEANKGAPLASVSAGWGFLSISYSGGADTLRKSTQPIYGSL